MLLSQDQVDELAEKVADRIIAKSTMSPRLVNRQELAALLNTSVPTIERLQKDGVISGIRIRGRVLYEVDRVLDQLRAAQTH